MHITFPTMFQYLHKFNYMLQQSILLLPVPIHLRGVLVQNRLEVHDLLLLFSVPSSWKLFISEYSGSKITGGEKYESISPLDQANQSKAPNDR